MGGLGWCGRRRGARKCDLTDVVWMPVCRKWNARKALPQVSARHALQTHHFWRLILVRPAWKANGNLKQELQCTSE
jgi:hypothetical protein